MGTQEHDSTVARKDREVTLRQLSVSGILKQAAFQFTEDRAFILAGALAFYASLSIGPLIVIALWVGGSIGPHAQEAFLEQIRALIGEGGGRVVEIIIANARDRPTLGNAAGVTSLIVLLISATAAFAHLQTTMNMVWNVRRVPGREIRLWFWKRLISLGMVVTVGFLLLVSLTVTAAIAFLADASRDILPGSAILWILANAAVTLSIFTVLLAAVFKFLPDVHVAWRDVWVGAAITGCFLWVGKELIGFYLGQSSIGSAYGAAGSLVVFLLWVYYSALLVFFGAEFTQVRARSHGRRIRPSGKAEWTARGDTP